MRSAETRSGDRPPAAAGQRTEPRRSGAAALVVFHLAVGARLAMRLFLPVMIAAASAVMLFGGQAVQFLATVAALCFGGDRGGGSAALVSACCVAGAATAAPRVCRGLDGWLRHLPATAAAHRRSAALAVAAAQAPILLGLAGLVPLAVHPPPAILGRWLGVAVAALAAALAVMPVAGRRWTRPLALVAAWLAASGQLAAVAAALALMAAADRLAGPLAPRRRRLPAPGQTVGPQSAAGHRLIDRVEIRIAWRALGGALAGAYLAGLLPLAATALFSVNNDLGPEEAALAERLGGASSLVLLLAALAGRLAMRRPAWPWARSLPWGAARRVGADAALLAVPALPLLVGLAWVAPLPAASAGALLPALALRAAGAMRRAPERRAGAAGEVLAEGLLAAGAVALVPWLCFAALAAVPFAWRAAAERERRQKVSRWLALHHLAAGDPQAWSGG
jgi:hypothetical protein